MSMSTLKPNPIPKPKHSTSTETHANNDTMSHISNRRREDSSTDTEKKMADGCTTKSKEFGQFGTSSDSRLEYGTQTLIPKERRECAIPQQDETRNCVSDQQSVLPAAGPCPHYDHECKEACDGRNHGNHALDYDSGDRSAIL
jgi:hypothetical protein